jgi:hypothetical protein
MTEPKVLTAEEVLAARGKLDVATSGSLTSQSLRNLLDSHEQLRAQLARALDANDAMNRRKEWVNLRKAVLDLAGALERVHETHKRLGRHQSDELRRKEIMGPAGAQRS